MPVELLESGSAHARPVHLVGKGRLDEAGLDAGVLAWAKENGFSGEAGRTLTVPGHDGRIAAALFGTGPAGRQRALDAGALARSLPAGDWRFAGPLPEPGMARMRERPCASSCPMVPMRRRYATSPRACSSPAT